MKCPKCRFYEPDGHYLSRLCIPCRKNPMMPDNFKPRPEVEKP